MVRSKCILKRQAHAPLCPVVETRTEVLHLLYVETIARSLTVVMVNVRGRVLAMIQCLGTEMGGADTSHRLRQSARGPFRKIGRTNLRPD